MKVLYVHHCASKGGASISLKNLILPLIKKGVEPLVLSPKGPVSEMFENCGIRCEAIPPVPGVMSLEGAPLSGISLLRLIPSWLRRLENHKKVLKFVKEFQPDVVHLNERHMLLLANQISKLGIPVVMHARSVASTDCVWAHGYKYINAYVNKLICIDQSVKRALKEVEPSRLEVVYNSVNYKNLPSPPTCERVAVDRPVRFMFLSNLLVYKGVWEIVEAVKILKDRNDFEVKILGGNSRPPEFFKTLTGKLARFTGLVRELDKELAQHIETHDLGTKIELCGFVNNFEEFLDSTDVNLFPSHLNGPSRSVFETGVREIPTILALKDRVEDVVEDGVTGIIVPPKNPRALAEAMIKLIEDRPLRKKLGAQAAIKYRKLFDESENSLKVFRVYQQLVTKKT